MKPARLCMIGDVAGQTDYHLGDEAMLEANIAAFRRLLPDIRFTVFTRDPIWTSVRYGVDAVRSPKFPRSVVPEVESALRQSDGLVVSGGGNICSSWPEKVEERIALIRTARDLDRPVVIVGQTLGPVLSDDQASRLADVLPWAKWVGVRDEPSAALALSLGVPADRIHPQLDDAFFLASRPVEDGRIVDLRRESRPLMLVTLDGSFGIEARRPALVSIAGQLDALAAALDVALVFVPHVGGAAVPAVHSDLVAGRALGDCLCSPLRILDLWQPSEVLWLVAQAAMVVSTRYHPLVFATAARTPAVGIHQDDYTRIKLRGALGHAGLEGWCLSLEDAERGRLLPLAVELWHQRQAVQARLAGLHADAGPREVQRWKGICQALERSHGSRDTGRAGCRPARGQDQQRHTERRTAVLFQP